MALFAVRMAAIKYS
jgi:hypothetical protein